MEDPFWRMQQDMMRMHQDMMRAFHGSARPGAGVAQQQRPREAFSTRVQEVDANDPQPGQADARDVPIVEEPDDVPTQQHRRRHYAPQQQARHNSRAEYGRQQGQSHQLRHFDPFGHQQMMPFGMGFGTDPFASLFNQFTNFGMGGSMDNAQSGTSYSYSSAYSSTTGPDGVRYEKTSSTRRGPGGISESRSTLRDGRTGEERMRLTRGLGDRQRTLERRRQGSSAPEETHEELQGINSGADAQAFDREWQHAARANSGLQYGTSDGAGPQGRRHRARQQGLPWGRHNEDSEPREL